MLGLVSAAVQETWQREEGSSEDVTQRLQAGEKLLSQPMPFSSPPSAGVVDAAAMANNASSHHGTDQSPAASKPHNIAVTEASAASEAPQPSESLPSYDNAILSSDGTVVEPTADAAAVTHHDGTSEQQLRKPKAPQHCRQRPLICKYPFP